MYLRYGFLADHITPGEADKKTVIGIFDLIVAGSFPAKRKTLAILARVEGSNLEAGPHRFLLELLDPDGQVAGKSKEMQFNLGRGVYADAPLAWECVTEIPDLVLPKPGTYEFAIRVDGRHIGSVPLYALQARDAQLKH